METTITFNTPLNIGDIIYVISRNNGFELAKVRNIQCNTFTLFEVENPRHRNISWGTLKNLPITLYYILERSDGYCTSIPVSDLHKQVGQTYFLSKSDLFNYYYPSDNINR